MSKRRYKVAMSNPSVMAIAHRGASEVAPENTLAAFEEALRMGAGAIEFDVRLSGDGTPVVLHDATVDRTTRAIPGITDSRVDQLSRLDLLRLDAGSWKHPRFAGVRIPTLEEALRTIWPQAMPVLELKVPIDPELLGQLLQRYASVEESLVISFEPTWLIPLRRRWRDLPLGLLAEQWQEDLPQRAKTLDVQVVVLNVEVLTQENILALQDVGLEVWCYTVNDVGMMAGCAAWGIKGIITDRPDLIRSPRTN